MGDRALSIFKFFQKGRKVEEQKVPINELDSWLSNRINDELHDVCAEGDDIRRHIQDSMLSIEQITEGMMGAGFKSVLIAAIDKANLASIEVLTFEDIVELRERAIQFMTHPGDVRSAYRRTTLKDAKSYAARMRVELKRINGEITRLNTLINKHSPRVTALRRCQEQARLLVTRVEEMRKMVEKRKELEKSLQSLESERAGVETKIERIKSTVEFEDSLRLRRELSMLENRRMEITSEVQDSFSALMRPLGKYCYAAEPSKERRSILDSYINETSRALSIVNDPVIQEILDDLRRFILQGRIKTKNPQKAILNTEKMMAELPELRQEYRRLTGQIESLQSRVKTAVEEDFERLEAKLEEVRGAISRVKLKSQEMKEAQPQLHAEVNTRVSQVEREIYESFEIPVRIQLTSDLNE